MYEVKYLLICLDFLLPASCSILKSDEPVYLTQFRHDSKFFFYHKSILLFASQNKSWCL
jgi:hypothetical protein